MLEVSDVICKRIAAAGRKGPVSVEAFVQSAVENELGRVECDRATQSAYYEIEVLARQVQKLEEGQRAIVALVDSSATVLAALIRGASR
jgi:hypothetical protein